MIITGLYRCLISLFYIKPQRDVHHIDKRVWCLISLFYIKPQQQAGYNPAALRCLISLFYIKPQRAVSANLVSKRCLISLFYIKPQPAPLHPRTPIGCLISLFYIKPQPCISPLVLLRGVLYRYSTSNHNIVCLHNSISMVSYIVILHQTTTSSANLLTVFWVSYIVILHQTTTNVTTCIFLIRCLISLFYIKPQRRRR